LEASKAPLFKLKMITWFDGSHDGAGGFQDSLIDGPLVWSEFAVGREGAGDV